MKCILFLPDLSFGLDTTDMTSTTTGGLDSVLDGHTENNSSDDDLSTTIDATDVQAIRRQLEGLESMYSEVLLHKYRIHYHKL